LADDLPDWTVRLDRLPDAVALVDAVTAANYPDGTVPMHSRWRHFELDGSDRWEEIWQAQPRAGDPHERLLAEWDLAVISVLLDAGAGPDWRYRDARKGQTWSRSEGLALATLEAFGAGRFGAPCQADGPTLASLSAEAAQRIFQVSTANPMVGIDTRAAVIQRLGDLIGSQRPSAFLLKRLAPLPAPIRAEDLLQAVLALVLTLWPDRPALEGQPLGDCWQDSAGKWVPLHKLAQWLTYSLVEPLQRAGSDVQDLHRLTGLAEYRNGGLFLDLGVIAPREPGVLTRRYQPGHPTIVEWRSLTVALLDRLTAAFCQHRGVDPAEWPVAKILQGGTWQAGRQLAAERRNGLPPLTIVSDGTVF
tara:strand:- start:118 stop:1203 length:1086 start_codon:yes stop_codon:yes gene_type:complete